MAKGKPADLVKVLLDVWESEGVKKEDMVDEKTTEKVIEKVIGLLDRQPDQPITPRSVMFAIGAFQRLKKISGNEGVLTKGLAEKILSGLFVADDNKDPSTSQRLTRKVNDNTEAENAFWVRYFVDTKSFKDFAGPQSMRDLCAKAWQLWVDECQFLLVREVLEPGPGVIVVRAGDVPEGVGRAPVLGPGKFLQTESPVVLDVKEINKPDDEFVGFACHEFGHIIGIGHLGKSGNLMSELVIDSIHAPTDADKEAAQRIYGKRELLPKPLDLDPRILVPPAF